MGLIDSCLRQCLEGGLIVCAPTEGYEVVQGDLCDLPVLTEEERDVLLSAAWELNEYLPPVVNGPAGDISADRAACPSNDAERPGDDFNRRGDVRGVLTQHGWTRTGGGDNEYWRRPGKAVGTSATLKRCGETTVLYVFSSNAQGLY